MKNVDPSFRLHLIRFIVPRAHEILADFDLFCQRLELILIALDVLYHEYALYGIGEGIGGTHREPRRRCVYSWCHTETKAVPNSSLRIPRQLTLACSSPSPVAEGLRPTTFRQLAKGGWWAVLYG